MSHRPLLLAASILLATIVPGALSAQQKETPYWASLRASEVNMRVGPSEDFPVSWVYRRAGLPVRVVRVREGWRLVEDPDGVRGWIVARLLSPSRGAIVQGRGLAPMRAGPGDAATLRWRLEPGVVLRLQSCAEGWCRVAHDDRQGYVEADRIWGD